MLEDSEVALISEAAEVLEVWFSKSRKKELKWRIFHRIYLAINTCSIYVTLGSRKKARHKKAGHCCDGPEPDSRSARVPWTPP